MSLSSYLLLDYSFSRQKEGKEGKERKEGGGKTPSYKHYITKTAGKPFRQCSGSLTNDSKRENFYISCRSEHC